MSRTLIVTGASSGIGYETTVKLLSHGYRVIGIARNFQRNPISDKNFIPRLIDLSKLSDLPQALSELNREYPEITGLIACAGRGHFGNIETFSYAQIRDLIELNFISQAFLVKAMMPGFKSSTQADIILIGSESALSGGKHGAIYCASKFALRGMAQSLRQECAASSVRVTLINPGMVRTPFFDSLHFEPGSEETHAIEADDVAEAILSVLQMRPGTVIDEINLSPHKKVIRRKNLPEMSSHFETD